MPQPDVSSRGASDSPSWRLATTALLAAYFLALGAALTTPVTDPDLWWHLATGRWMWERGALPHAEPFTFTAAAFPPAPGSEFLLRQYWLAELLLLGVHTRFGLEGVILLRAAAHALMFFLLYRLLRSLGAAVPAAVLLVALVQRVVVGELGYVGDRPQMWTSLFFVAALLLVQRQREGRRPAFVALPLLLLLWSNLHGGYLLGLALVALTAAAAEIAGEATARSRVSSLAALALGACNPAGLPALLSYVAGRLLEIGSPARIVEETSLAHLVSLSSSPRLVPGLLALLALSLASLLPRLRAMARERPDLLALYALTLAMGAVAARFVIFFAVVAAVLIAVNAPALAAGARARFGSWAWSGRGAALGALTLLVLASLTVWHLVAAARSSALRPAAAWHHPYGPAADFLESAGVRGNLFGEYGAGGYLAWRLYPSARVFIHGRVLSPGLLVSYEDLLLNPSAPQGGRLRYQEVFDGLHVDALVLPTCNPVTGLIIPLAVVVARDPAWTLVHGDETAVVLMRRAKAPPAALAAAPPPAVLYDNMLALAESAGRSGHGRVMPGWRYSRAFALYGRGERTAALAALDEYLLLAPGHAAAARVRDRIRRELEAGAGASPNLEPGGDALTPSVAP